MSDTPETPQTTDAQDGTERIVLHGVLVQAHRHEGGTFAFQPTTEEWDAIREAQEGKSPSARNRVRRLFSAGR